MRCRLLKILGDNNKGDYYTENFWCVGHCYTPKVGSNIGMINTTECSEDDWQGGIFIEQRITKVLRMTWGWIVKVGEKEIWTIKELSNETIKAPEIN